MKYQISQKVPRIKP